MLSNKIITVLTSQDQSAFIWRHTAHQHAAGNSVTTHVKLPRTKAHDGFPIATYHVSVTPEQVCAVAVTNKTTDGFDVTFECA
jgi:hypothetical protein